MAKGLRFKKGDIVEVVSNTAMHDFKSGQRVKITDEYPTYTTPCYYAESIDGRNDGWYINDVDVMQIKKQTKMATTGQNLESLRRALVLAAAQTLLAANNTVTTLEIKTELRKSSPQFYWVQAAVSTIMDDFATKGMFTFSNNGSFRTYSDPTKVKVAKTAKKAVKMVQKAKTTTNKAVNWTATSGSISRKKALELMKNNKGHFFSAWFTKKDGSDRVINCQYLSNQTGSDLGYVKVNEASLVRAKDANPIRQINLQTLKGLSIAGNSYKIR